MSNQVRVQTPTFEHHHSGLGVDTSTPRISWSFSCDNAAVRGWIQCAYEIELTRIAGQSSSECYRVHVAESVLVPWPSEPLRSRERAKVRVRVYGKTADRAETLDAEPSEWSSWADVECALLERSDWSARPITAPFTEFKSDELIRPLLFRQTFNLPNGRGNVTRARLYITAFGVYEPYLNGSRVGDYCMAPGWTSYKHHLNYQIFDITSQVREDGLNVIGVEAAPGWYLGRLGFWGGRLGIYGKDICTLAQLEVEFDQGERYTLVSDDTWGCQFSPLMQSEIYDGETYDMREECNGWTENKFDANSWAPAKLVEFPQTQLVAPDAPPVRVTEEISPVDILKTPSGKTIIDFGQNLVGKLHIREISKPSGTKITFSHAEVLDKGELGIIPLRGAKCTDVIITSGRPLLNWSPKFTFHGFRYVQVEGWETTDESEPLTKESISALVIHSDLRRTGWFECSHPLVNKLHQNALWSMRGNFLSIPTDCPQRDERMGWTGDIQVFAPSANFLYDTASMLGGWLQDLASEQAEQNGVPPLVVPNILQLWPVMPQAVWDDVTVLLPWELYRASGDVDILRKQYQSMLTWVDKGVRRGEDGLWDPELWQLGDWLDPKAPPQEPGDARTDATLVADCYLVHVTSIVARVSSILQDAQNSERVQADALRVKRTFQHKYIAPSGLLIGDTQTALALSIMYDIHETAGEVKAAAARLARLVRLARFRVSTGFAGTPIITHALSKTGYNQLAYRMLLEKRCPSWMYPITMGATTIWERWDSMLPDGSLNTGDMTSFNHYALGSIVDWMHKVVGGIRPLDAGWRKILVKPQPGGTIRNAKVAYESPYGEVRCEWSIEHREDEGEVFKMRLAIPPNSEARVILPRASNEGKNRTSDAMEDAERVGSGIHMFTCEYTADPWPPKAISTFMGEPDDGEFV